MTAPERLRERLLGPEASPREVRWAWWGPLLVMVLGGVLRFVRLGHPHQLVFDETYYVKQGWSMILYGHERRVRENLDEPDVLFTAGTPNVFGTAPDMVVHPPVGKWMIGAGEWLLGVDSSFSWRFAVALCGTLSILLVGRAAWHLFGNATLATAASLLLAFEGHHFVHSRTGLLDLFVMFWALAAFCALLADRRRTRLLLAKRMAVWRSAPAAARSAFGPWLGWRPWRWVAAVCLGLSAGSKWSGVFFLVVFGLLTVWWDLGARRTVGTPRWVTGTVVRDALYAAVVMVGVAVATYVASWAGWFRSDDGYDRLWARGHDIGAAAAGLFGATPAPSLLGTVGSWFPDALRSLWHYHATMMSFHVGLTSSHPYEANPWSWIIQGRPTSFFYESPTMGQDGCLVEQCSKAITSLGTVSIWWAATLGIPVLAFMWLLRRDWRAGAVLSGLVAGWLPWFLYQERTIYTFYSVAFVPWVVLIVVYLLGMALGRPGSSRTRRRVGVVIVGAFVLLTVALFAFYYPIYTAEVIPRGQWHQRMWFNSWI